VTAEYNHPIPAALKNAIDPLDVEWNNKAPGFVATATPAALGQSSTWSHG
jgi:NAD(P)H-dependent FMN reductase